MPFFYLSKAQAKKGHKKKTRHVMARFCGILKPPF
jgi:hypothetical protein